jgi:hypothetical protein
MFKELLIYMQSEFGQHYANGLWGQMALPSAIRMVWLVGVMNSGPMCQLHTNRKRHILVTTMCVLWHFYITVMLALSLIFRWFDI